MTSNSQHCMSKGSWNRASRERSKTFWPTKAMHACTPHAARRIYCRPGNGSASPSQPEFARDKLKQNIPHPIHMRIQVSGCSKPTTNDTSCCFRDLHRAAWFILHTEALPLEQAHRQLWLWDEAKPPLHRTAANLG